MKKNFLAAASTSFDSWHLENLQLVGKVSNLVLDVLDLVLVAEVQFGVIDVINLLLKFLLRLFRKPNFPSKLKLRNLLIITEVKQAIFFGDECFFRL